MATGKLSVQADMVKQERTSSGNLKRGVSLSGVFVSGDEAVTEEQSEEKVEYTP